MTHSFLVTALLLVCTYRVHPEFANSAPSILILPADDPYFAIPGYGVGLPYKAATVEELEADGLLRDVAEFIPDSVCLTSFPCVHLLWVKFSNGTISMLGFRNAIHIEYLYKRFAFTVPPHFQDQISILVHTSVTQDVKINIPVGAATKDILQLNAVGPYDREYVVDDERLILVAKTAQEWYNHPGEDYWLVGTYMTCTTSRADISITCTPVWSSRYPEFTCKDWWSKKIYYDEFKDLISFIDLARYAIHPKPDHEKTNICRDEHPRSIPV